MNKIRVLFAPGERMIVAPAEFKRNTGQVLEVYGVPFDEGAVLRVAFISDGDDGAVPATGTVENGTLSIPIPDDKFFDLDEDGGDEGRIRAYFAVVDDDSITTEYCVVIPLIDSPPMADPYEDATPEQRSAIDEIIRQMTTTAEAAETAKQKAETAADKSETNVTKYPKIVDGKWYVWDADAGDFVDTGIKAVGEDGKDGQPGAAGTPGAAGKDGQDGYSPSAKVEAVTGGAKITITDKSGTTTATVTNGKDGAAGQPGEKGDPGTPGAAGKDGKDGADGVSPTAKVEAVTGGAKVTITDKNGTTTVTLTNGQDGQPGAAGTPGAAGKDGQDGYSPSAKVEAVTGGAKITITDKSGTTTANISNGTNGSPGAKGDPGDDGFSPSASVTQTSSGATISITDKNGTTSATITNGKDGKDGAAGQPGEKGDPGTPGAAGKDGVDGVSPTAKVEAITGGAKITITDKSGTTTANISNGTNGSPGAKGDPGDDGFSPSASVTQTSSGATISITDKNGTTSATITNGKNGKDGAAGSPGAAGKDGADGYSPSAKVETVTGGAKITITDKDGTTTATVTNGTNGSPGAAGKDGADGYSPSATVTQTSTGATITITDANGTTTANITNGAKGDPGDDYVLTAQDKSDIAEIVAENGLFYETHCNGQVFNVSSPGATWVNTDGTMNGLQARRYVFDADGVQDVVQLSRVYDSSVENYCYTGTSETLGITLTYYYSNTLINQSHIEFSNNVSKFKMYIYSSTALVELKTRHNIGQAFANNILSLIDDYYDNGDTSYYG